MQVILDDDVAKLFGYETKNINRAAARNKERFPLHFRFQLIQDEVNEILRCQIGTSSLAASVEAAQYGGRRYLPWAYSEHGVISLAGVLRSKNASRCPRTRTQRGSSPMSSPHRLTTLPKR
ncbi:MAG: ORF6N domain-containing protein [Coriobacteriales bacterium]|nr:ORF6N domain-containing protein [Coriobacteriales bacterium]